MFGFSDLMLRLHVDEWPNHIEKAPVLKYPRSCGQGLKYICFYLSHIQCCYC